MALDKVFKIMEHYLNSSTMTSIICEAILHCFGVTGSVITKKEDHCQTNLFEIGCSNCAKQISRFIKKISFPTSFTNNDQ